MTAPLLLACIAGAVFLQVAFGVGFAVWRRRGVAGDVPIIASETARRVPAGAWPGSREFRVTRREFEDSAHTKCSFFLEPVDGIALPGFKPGQFLTFSLRIAERTITRCYSLSDRPEPARYRITVKRMAGGASSNHFHDRVHEGDVLQVRAPSGRFCIDPDPNVPVVLVGGGIGVTPLLSMLRWCMAEQPARIVNLYYCLRSGDEHAFKQELERMATAHPSFHLNVVYSSPGPGDVQGRDFHHVGRIDVELLRKTLPHGRHQFYVCGPAAMMEALVPALADWGVPESDIHFEAFGPASVLTAGAATSESGVSLREPVEVKLLRSGRTLVWEGKDESLLDFAERHGVAIDSGCRSGSCGSCETRLVSGSVCYAQRPDHDVTPGHCLPCVGRPTSALVLEA